MWGDPGEMYKRIEMLLFSFNGAVCCDSAYRDRAKLQCECSR